MIEIICGEKGKGKTKDLLEKVKENLELLKFYAKMNMFLKMKRLLKYHY